MSARGELAALYRAALDEVHAGRALERAFAEREPEGAAFALLAAGKAACAMAEAARARLGARLRRGLVTTRQDCARSLPGLEVKCAGHPLPDGASERCAREALALAGSLAPDETLLVLLSGGASALWCAPAEGLSLEDKRAATQALLRVSATIGEVNTVRRHLSALKGGGLARAANGRAVELYAVSDVPGDALHDLGSGPASPDPTTFADALAVVRRHGIEAELTPAARAQLERGAAGALRETAKPGDACFERARARVVADLRRALEAVERAARGRGWKVRALGRALDGDVTEVAPRLAREVDAARAEGADLVVAGGEPTVRVRGPGLGGRAQELAVRLAFELDGRRGFSALCAGTDGSDGPTDAAGAFADGSSLGRMRERGLLPERALDASDVHPLLAANGDLFHTGPTETNVADLLLVRVERA